jgi:alpha-N-arabinofuranosidase
MRAANGHAKPYQVRYWQLGNELGGASYAENCVAFCKAMKQADSTVSLISSFPSQDVLDRVGTEIAYIGPHHYTTDLAACEAEFKNLSAMIRNTPGCSRVRIAVTEWNSTGGWWGLGRAKLMTLECALQNARYLNLLIRQSGIVDIACRSNMTNSLGSGVIETRPSGLLRRAGYYAMSLYAQHGKPIPHAVEGAPEGVDLAACASDDGSRLCVFAVNTKAEPFELTLDLSEFGTGFGPVGGEVVCDTQDRRQPDVMNHWAAPDRIIATKLRVSQGKLVLPALSASAIECGNAR